VASYLQTLCLTESFRTSFSDLLSLISVFSGDIRRALLALQVCFETGSICRQKMAMPTCGPCILPIAGTLTDAVDKSAQLEIAVDAGKQKRSQVADSGDEFTPARPRKRRALRVASSDEDSQSLGGVPTSVESVVIDSGSHQGCEDTSVIVTVDNSEELAGPASPPVAMAADLAPCVHRLHLAMLGGCELHNDHVQLTVSLMPFYC